MANIILKDRVKVSSGVTGTGTATLGAAANGFQDFGAIGTGNTTYYTIALQSGNEWEVGQGVATYTGGTWYLSRDVVLSSSNANTLVDFSAGTKDVFVTYPAEKAIYEEASGNVLIDGGPITVIGGGVTSYMTFSAALGEMYADVNSFAQFYAQNYSTGSEASGDFVVYREDALDDTSKFVDMGINSSAYSSASYPIFSAGSAYVFNDGGEMFFGSATDDVVLFAGGVDTVDEAVRIKATDKSVELASDLSVAGTATVTGAAEFQSTVLLAANPTLALQAATKDYVDLAVSTGLHVHQPVLVATTANLTATYSNGTAGVGATLTNSGAQVAISIDGIALSSGDRVLVWQQSTQAQNGVYSVTTVGSGSTNWVLTRTTDTDHYAPQDVDGLGGGDYFYVQSGTTGAGDSYICTNEGTITFGTTAITFSQFSGAITYTGGTNIDVTGQVISLTGTVAATNGGTGASTVTTGDLLYGSGTNTWGKLAAGASYKPLVMNGAGTLPEWNALALDQTGTVSGSLPTVHGGTALTSYTLGDLIYSSATNTLSKLAGNTTITKTFLVQTGAGGGVSAAPAWGTIAAADVSGLASSATTDTTNAANITSGTLPVARLNGSYTGIIGVGTLAAGTWNGSTIAAAYGGTGQSSYAVGDLLYADTTTSLAKLPDVIAGNALLSGGVGTAPAWGKVGLQTHVDGTLAIVNGGTGATTRQDAMDALAGAVTSGQYLRGNGTDVVMSAIQAADVPTLNQSTTGNAATATAASTIAVANDTTTNATVYPLWATGTSSGTAAKIASTKLFFNPSTGALTANELIVTGGGGEGGQLTLRNVAGTTTAGVVDVDAGNDMRVFTTGTSLWFGTGGSMTGRLIGTEWRSGGVNWQFTDSTGLNMMTLYSDGNGARAEVTYLAVGTRRPATRGAIDIDNGRTLTYGPYYALYSGGTTPVSSATAGIAIYADQRIVAAEVDANSDIRQKENIVDIDEAAALKFVLNAKTVQFNWKQSANKGGGTTYGWLAQDVLKHGFPYLINAGECKGLPEYDDGEIRVDADIELHANYMAGVSILQAAMKEQQRMIEELRAELNALKGKA